MQFIEDKIISRIYGHGRGWCFSQADFIDLAPRGTIDSALHRFAERGTIRRVTRGLYDYPRYSDYMQREMGPEMDQASHALARKYKWHIVPNGPTSLYLLGLSTQVPARYVYISSGPNKKYDLLGSVLEFRHQKTQQTFFKYPESALIVQSIQSLGKDGITPLLRESIGKRFKKTELKRIIRDTTSVSGWIHDQIKTIAAMKEEEDKAGE